VSSLLVLVRHAESTKNTNPRFSTVEGQELLTEAGCRQAMAMAQALGKLVKQLNPTSIGYFSPPTERTLATARALACSSTVTTVEDLCPIRSPYPGLTEEEVSKRDPHFSLLLRDYRNGLRNAYDIPRGSGEQVLQFERRVSSAVDLVLSQAHSLTVVVGHRSTITATLLRATRVVGGYPLNWYGHVNVPLGSISTIEVDENLQFCGLGRLCDVSFLLPGDLGT
jgi:broad specificity phosphatase PhoE